MQFFLEIDRKGERESERKWQNRRKMRIRRKRCCEEGGDEGEEGEEGARECVPTNRETCACVFSYVRCVAASRRFRVFLSCEVSRYDATRHVVRIIIETRVTRSRIE